MENDISNSNTIDQWGDNFSNFLKELIWVVVFCFFNFEIFKKTKNIFVQSKNFVRTGL